MRLQLDTSVQIHKLLNRSDDPVNSSLIDLTKNSESVDVLVQRKLDKSSLRLRDLAFGKEVFLGIGEIAEIS